MQEKLKAKIKNADKGFISIIFSSGINLIFRIFGLITSFLTTMMVTRLFGIDTHGNYSLVFTIAQATAMIFALGIPSALIKIVGNNNLNFLQAKKILLKAIKVTAGFSIIPILVFSFGADYISEEFFNNSKLVNYFFIITLSMPLFIFHEIFLYFFIAVKKFRLYNLFMFVLPNFFLIIFLLLFYYFNQPEHYTFLAFAISIFIVVVMEAIAIFELNPKKESSFVSTKELVKIASPLMFSGLMLYLLNWTAVIMLGMMMTDKDVGIYNVAYRVGTVGFLIIISVNLIIMPKMAELYGQKNMVELKKLIHRSTKLIAVLSVPIVLVLIIFREFILSIFSAEAVEGSTSLIIIAVGVLFSAICGNVDQILNMTNNERLFRNIAIFCFFVNVAFNYLLIPYYGIEGAAMSSLITNVLLNAIGLFYMKKKLGFYTFA